MVKRNPDIAFTRNPIRFTDIRPGSPTERSFSVSVGGLKRFTGYYRAPTTVDVAEIAEAYVDPIPSPEDIQPDSSGILLQLEDSSQFGKRLVKVKDGEGESLMTDFYALPGGISPQNFRRLAQLDSDIFAARLIDRRRNFFLTTRTHGWRILIDELELFPLAFVVMFDEDAKVWLRAAGTSFTSPEMDLTCGIHALDIEKARMAIAEEYGLLASVFDVLYDGFLACQIVITETDPEKDTTMVKFRNSLGAFELIHLSGAKETKPSPREPSTQGKRYDSSTGRYVSVASRRTIGYKVDAYSGYRTADRMRFLLDMAASEEVYIKDRTGWVRVQPSIESLSLKDPQLQPQMVKVSFELSDEYDNYTPDINDLDDFLRPRIFSEQYTDEFN